MEFHGGTSTSTEASTKARPFAPRILTVLLFHFGTIWLPISIRAAEQSPGDTASYVKTNYLTAQSRYLRQTNSAEAAWQFGRACFDRADIATNNAERALFAQQGIRACEAGAVREPNLAAVRYYLGMNLAQLAQTKGLGALTIVNRMEKEFAAARNLDEKLDFAGEPRDKGSLHFRRHDDALDLN